MQEHYHQFYTKKIHSGNILQKGRPEHKIFLLAYAKIHARAYSLNVFCLFLFLFITERVYLKSDNTKYMKNNKVNQNNNNNNSNNNNNDNNNNNGNKKTRSIATF